MTKNVSFTVLSINSILMILLSGCIAPINSTFESAKLLDERAIELQGNYSKYYGGGVVNLNNNFGFGIGYGVSDKYNIKFRYERIDTKPQIELLGEEPNIGGANYLEISNKYRVKEGKMSVSIPVGAYVFDTGETPLFTLEPRIIYTFSNNDKFEFNLIPKAHIFLGDVITYTPGINLGLGFSSNLNNWAIRPELGYDGYITFGIGTNFYFNPAKRD